MTVTYGLASKEAAEYAVTHWHYSKSLPVARAVRVGVWEDGKFIGVVIFSNGANPKLYQRYELAYTEICEMTRVALNAHKAPVTQIVSHALQHLKATNPEMRLVVSFADPAQGHHGGIYQAGNWVYTGTTGSARYMAIRGKEIHPRQVAAKYGTNNLQWIRDNVDPNVALVDKPPKHRYVMPLDKPMRRKVMKLARPYPPPVNT